MPALLVSVVGAKHHEGGEARLAELTPGMPVDLVRQPDNPYDPRCVAVHINGGMAGYIPRFRNRDLAAALDAGIAVSAEGASKPGEISIKWKDKE